MHRDLKEAQQRRDERDPGASANLVLWHHVERLRDRTSTLPVRSVARTGRRRPAGGVQAARRRQAGKRTILDGWIWPIM